MENKMILLDLIKEIESNMWFRYLPETTFKTYLMLGHIQADGIQGEEVTSRLINTTFDIESEVGQLREEKEKVLAKIGIKYPTNRVEDLDILKAYTLLIEERNENGELTYKYNMPIPHPQDVFKLDEEELQTLRNIAFEVEHQNAFDNILTLLLNSNGNLLTSMEHISTTTKVKHSDIREVLDYLVNEGSVKVKSDKSIKELRKSDKVYITIVKEIFEQKRFVID